MAERTNSLDMEPATVPEYSYEEGLDKIAEIIMGRLEKNPHIAVAFKANAMHVGKSRLSSEIARKLYEQRVRSVVFHDEYELERYGQQILRSVTEYGNQAWFIPDKMVIIFDQADLVSPPDDFQVRKKIFDKKIGATLEKLGYDVAGVHLWVGVYRPDKPFSSRPNVDVIVRNEKAVDK
jgi:hypothetical protein